MHLMMRLLKKDYITENSCFSAASIRSVLINEMTYSLTPKCTSVLGRQAVASRAVWMNQSFKDAF